MLATMRKNKHTYIHGTNVILVPYDRCHVPRYHGWMKSAELQELTASEPLSLDEEYQMQQSWREDEQKCTFIILDAQRYSTLQDKIQTMVGDVNLFFNDSDDQKSAELEIMIAEVSARGKGFGKEALLAMMWYGVKTLDVKRYTAKIGMSNAASIALFSKIGFHEVSRSDVFHEITFEVKADDKFVNWLELQNKHLKTTERQSR